MIYSTLEDPSDEAFEELLANVRESLETAGRADPEYMRRNSGIALEDIVLEHMLELSKKTPFAGTIEKISGKKFPDIIARGFFGVEVKSSLGEKWQTIGNSVNESTRIEGLSTIYIIFGQLHDTISFRTRRYQDCLCDIRVTHYPRYWIDMDLREGETIFDKMKISYDELRLKEDPFTPIRDYYRNLKKPGETLWWIDERGANAGALSPIVRLLKDIPLKTELKQGGLYRESILAQALILFPIILARGSREKYNEVAGWLVARHGIVSAALRDSFSAGGKCKVSIKGNLRELPAVFGRILEAKEDLKTELQLFSDEELAEWWNIAEAKLSLGRGKIWGELANKAIRTHKFPFEFDIRDIVGEL